AVLALLERGDLRVALSALGRDALVDEALPEVGGVDAGLAVDEGLAVIGVGPLAAPLIERGRPFEAEQEVRSAAALDDHEARDAGLVGDRLRRRDELVLGRGR